MDDRNLSDNSQSQPPTEQPPAEAAPAGDAAFSPSEVLVTLESPAVAPPPPPGGGDAAGDPSADAELTASMLAEVMSGGFAMAGGAEVDYSAVPWAFTDGEKKALAADLAPVLKKHGVAAMPYPEETRAAIGIARTVAPRLMKLRQRKRGGPAKPSEAQNNGDPAQHREEGRGQVDASAAPHLAAFGTARQ